MANYWRMNETSSIQKSKGLPAGCTSNCTSGPLVLHVRCRRGGARGMSELVVHASVWRFALGGRRARVARKHACFGWGPAVFFVRKREAPSGTPSIAIAILNAFVADATFSRLIGAVRRSRSAAIAVHAGGPAALGVAGVPKLLRAPGNERCRRSVADGQVRARVEGRGRRSGGRPGGRCWGFNPRGFSGWRRVDRRECSDSPVVRAAAWPGTSRGVARRRRAGDEREKDRPRTTSPVFGSSRISMIDLAAKIWESRAGFFHFGTLG